MCHDWTGSRGGQCEAEPAFWGYTTSGETRVTIKYDLSFSKQIKTGLSGVSDLNITFMHTSAHEQVYSVSTGNK